MAEPEWTSAHIHYHDSLDDLIIDAVRPLVEELTDSGLTDGHFFVRHWQAGPHLRLRLKPASPSAGAKVAELLDRHIGGFLDSRPSRTVIDEPDYLRVANPLAGIERGQDVVEPLQPNNSIRAVPYEPEYARYGGTREAMRVVERHFTESSDLVAELLATGKTGDQRTGQALAMMLAGAMVASGGADGLLGHLSTGQRDWGRRLVFGHPAVSENRFEEKFQRQRSHLVGLVEKLVRLVDSGATERAGSAVARWTASTTSLRDNLIRLRRQGLFAPQELLTAPAERDDADLRSVLLFCSHMHNNRLGVSLPEESYLMYLLWRAVSEITGGAS
ncbi:thiopeptide-type bacteriocin biosynthesis protein [Saccharopolyspora sp. 5N708]|uniref:thiopeptide-type bacteriocin biosynthesis protein n=1 Tax=Saccharopolyspora sp. 5N708 TaxID=3457424 RepID=UPI003FD4164A